MTQIERRQARLRRIRALHRNIGRPLDENIPASPEAHHIIGVSQNLPVDIPEFLRKNVRDPAVKVGRVLVLYNTKLTCPAGQDFVPKLNDHLLPRVRDILRQEAPLSGDESNYPQAGLSALQGLDTEKYPIFIKGNRMYRHNLARFNYTTYDIRRDEDVINPSTSHRDIMVLSNNTDNGGSNHPFLYARVLGIYHVNVVYTGEGSLDYVARRVEFLWVRWFKYAGDKSVTWADMKLDPVCFPPMADQESFGFVDPRHVLRGCHIIPAFAGGKARMDRMGLSRLAADAHDWSQYRINRYVI